MLNISLPILVFGRTVDLLFGKAGLQGDQAKSVLKLVPEAIGAPRLVKAGSSPKPGA